MAYILAPASAYGKGGRGPLFMSSSKKNMEAKRGPEKNWVKLIGGGGGGGLSHGLIFDPDLHICGIIVSFHCVVVVYFECIQMWEHYRSDI